LEDLPEGIDSASALDYLAAWTSLWDPRLLVAFGSAPEWRRCDTSGLDVEDALICCPDASAKKLDQPLEERLSIGRNHLVASARRCRREIVHDLLRVCYEQSRDGSDDESRPGILSDESCCLLQDFYAFAYAVLQVQCMARKLRYSFNMDWLAVGEQIQSAAKASLQGDRSETDRWLTAAFDSLSQERDRYCSQQGHLLDLVLIAPTTLGDTLLETLHDPRPVTLYANTLSLQQCKNNNPNAWTLLRQRLADKSLCLAGGLRSELPHHRWPESVFLNELVNARRDCHDLGIAPPEVWLRFTPQMAATFPTVARQFGFQGAILASLGGGSIPKKEHAKIQWKGAGDRGGIDCILGHVFDAADGVSLLQLGAEMAKQLDYHQIPTLVLGHWPGQTNAAYGDLLRATERTPALGKWVDAHSYFASTAQPYWSDQFTSLDFQSPSPSNPSEIHASHGELIRGLRLAYRLEALDSICRLWNWTPRLIPRAHDSESDLETHRGKCADLLDALIHPSATYHRLEIELTDLESAIAEALRARVPCEDYHDVVFNPTSQSQRVFLADYPRRLEEHSCTRIVAAVHDSHQSQCVVEVPSFGFVKLSSEPPLDLPSLESTQGTDSTGSPRSSWIGKIFGNRPVIAQEDGSLANEFMEVQIDPSKGHLRSFYVVNKRGNRLSGQLSWANEPIQLRRPFSEISFLGLSEVRMRIVHNSRVRGSIEVTGSMGSGGGTVAICYTLWRGAKWVDVEIQGSGADAQIGFPVWRMVWPSEAATLASWSQGIKGKLPAPLQAAVEMIEIDDAEHRLYFATRGLSIHRRVGLNGLASALPVDKSGTFLASFSLGFDWTQPWETAMDRMNSALLSPARGTSRPATAGKATDAGAWLARCNMPNIRFRWIDPSPAVETSDVQAVEPDVHPSGILADASLWAVETAGKSGIARFSCVRPIRDAWRVDFRGFEYDKLKVDKGEVLVPFQGWERSRIALCFEK
jgi:alpha-mannosidase